MLDNHANYVSSFLFNCLERFIENCSFWNKLTSSTSCVLLTFYVLLSISICFLPRTFRNPHPKYFPVFCVWLIPRMLFQAFLLYTFVKVDCPYVFAALCTVYIRYRWLRLVSNEERSLRCCNIMALVFGGLSALGLSLVANFQVTIKTFFYYLLEIRLFSKSNVKTDCQN